MHEQSSDDACYPPDEQACAYILDYVSKSANHNASTQGSNHNALQVHFALAYQQGNGIIPDDATRESKHNQNGLAVVSKVVWTASQPSQNASVAKAEGSE